MIEVPMESHALLLTGEPGVGKTTALRRVCGALGVPARGFLTEEIRTRGTREGFRLETLDGQRAVLARVGLVTPHRVGRYGVDVPALERVVAAALVNDPATQVYIIDEIGKMECLSNRFVAAVEALLAARRTVVATVALHGTGFMAAVKQRPGVEVWEITGDNRDDIPARVLEWLERADKQGA